MKGFFWVAACGVAAVAGLAVQNGEGISDAFDAVTSEGSLSIDLGDGDALPAPPAPPAPPTPLSEGNEAAIDAAVDRLAEAQSALAAIRANQNLTPEQREAALAAAQKAREEALAALRDASRSADPGSQIASGVEGAIQGVISAVEQSDARIERDGRVLEGEERTEAIAEARTSVREAVRELRDEIRD